MTDHGRGGADRRLGIGVPELGRHSVQGGLTLLGAQLLALGITIGSTMVLARLLGPHDFGIAAMALVIVGVVGPLKDFGFSQAVAYHADVGHDELSGLFGLNLRLSALLALVMAAVAPVLAWFFREPSVTALSLLLAAAVFTRGIGNLHYGLLRRQMRFRALAVVDAGSLLIGAVVGIGLAARGAGAWALVSQYVGDAAPRFSRRAAERTERMPVVSCPRAPRGLRRRQDPRGFRIGKVG